MCGARERALVSSLGRAAAAAASRRVASAAAAERQSERGGDAVSEEPTDRPTTTRSHGDHRRPTGPVRAYPQAAPRAHGAQGPRGCHQGQQLRRRTRDLQEALHLAQRR